MAEVLTPIIGFGFEFSMSTDGGTNYSTVGQIEDLAPPGGKCKDIDVSYIQMAEAWRLFIAGLADGEEASFKLIFNHTKYATLLANFRITNKWKVTFSDVGTTGSTVVFSGHINGYKNVTPMDDKVTADFTIKVSGKPVFTAGT